MKKSTKGWLIGASLLLVGVLIAGGILARTNTSEDLSAEGFNGIVESAKNKHPEIYAWWEALPTSHQIQVESAMTLEILNHLERDFRKRNLSPETIQLLRQAGYQG